MVGDSPSNDVAFGKSAGVSTALLDTGRRSTVQNQKRDDHGDVVDGGRTTPDIVVDDLSDLAQELWKNFEIEGHLGSSLLKYDTPTPTTEAAIAAAAGDLEALATFTIDQLNEQDETQNTPLIWASDAGQENVVRFLLLEKKRQKKTMIDLDVRGGYLGATAVCRAARRGHTEILKLLAAGGADLDIPNTKLQFPLHFAAFKEHPEAVEALLEHGANPRVLDRKGRVPARDTKNVSIRDRLLKAMQ